MLGIFSSGSSLAWNWIIEYLSSFPQIDTSTICRLIDTSPLLPEDFEESTNEMVSLRCLEHIFGPENSLESVTPPVSRVTNHPSPSCNAFLQRLLREVPLSNLENAGPELLEWDGDSFIKDKRATLPKCALEKLKDFILVDGTVSDGDEKGPPPRSDDKMGNQEGNLIQVRRNGKFFLDFDTLLRKDQLSSKRCRDDMVVGNSVGVGTANHLNAKKSKQDVSEIEGNDLGTDSRLGEGDRDVRVAPSSRTSTSTDGLQQNTDPGEEKTMPSEDPVKKAGRTEQMACDRCRDDMVAGNSVGVCTANHLNAKKSKQDVTEIEGNDLGTDSRVGEGDRDVRVAPSSRTSTSTDRLQQNTDAGEEKAMPSEDPVNKAGQTEQMACDRCNKNGQVLVCSGCPRAVHESCLNSPVRFDDKGNFLCPFCAYSVSMSRYKEAKDRMIVVRKKLVSFMGLMGNLAQEQGRIRNHLILPKSESSDGEESSSTTAEDKFVVSSYSTRSRLHEPKFCFPPTFEMRRKKDPWTKDEEEKLRKVVQEFADKGETIPWKRILELGNQVFLKVRTPTDLKNKWRSMCKGSPRCK